MRSVLRLFFIWTWVAGAVLAPGLAWGFATGTPLSLTIDPATVRQKSEKAVSKVTATVQLNEPSPTFFVCIIRTDQQTKIAFPTIVFRKGDLKGKSEGNVQWKSVLHECRVRVSAYNADAPDRKLTFTVTLIPVQQLMPDAPDQSTQ